MKVCIMSDSHGNLETIFAMIQREEPELLLHAGDFATDIQHVVKKMTEETDPVPVPRMIEVAGNCDLPGAANLDRLERVGNCNVFITHGHRNRVKEGYLHLTLKAEEMAANLIVFGHTHTPALFIEGGRLFVNPGSMSQPRGYKTPTYVTLEWPNTGDGPITIFYKSSYDGSECEDLKRQVKWNGSTFQFA